MYSGRSQFDKYSFDSLTNVPALESIFFPIKSFPNGNLGRRFHYENGVYPGQFRRVVGKGAEGVVIEGIWNNEKAAFKFVRVRDQKAMKTVQDGLADMNVRLREMLEMESITGSNILKFYGHFR